MTGQSPHRTLTLFDEQTRRPGNLDVRAIDTFLRGGRWAILATAHDGHPYAVPVAYGWDGRDFFIAMATGRKTRNLRANPVVCLTITAIEENGRLWCSVVAEGHAVALTALEDRFYAFATLRQQHANDTTRAQRSAEALAKAVVIRITPNTMTGRTEAYYRSGNTHGSTPKGAP